MKKIPKIKIGVCAASYVGYELLSFVLRQKHKIEFVATYKHDESGYEEKIVALCRKYRVKLLHRISAHQPELTEEIKTRSIDLMLLLWWPEIIREPAIGSVKIGWTNLHPSLLPFNRGKHGYFWAIVEGTPFGATIHLINEQIDAGNILFQEQIPIDITDTGESLYKKSRSVLMGLFKKNYHRLVNLDFSPVKQSIKGRFTSHFGKELDSATCIDLNKTYKAIDLINIIRGRTFWNGDAAFFYKDGIKYHIRTEIKKAPPAK